MTVYNQFSERKVNTKQGICVKPNLKVLSMNEIDLYGELELTDDLIQQIRTASPPDKDGYSFFFDVYKVENSSHVGLLMISVPVKRGKTCDFSLHYEVGTWGKPRKKYPSIDQALGILASIDGSIELDCFSIFDFAKRDKVKTILNLPLIVSESPNLPFDQVRGFHFSKMEGKHSKYDVILDRGEDGRLKETVVFRYTTTKINDSLTNDVVNKAVEISEQFAVKEK